MGTIDMRDFTRQIYKRELVLPRVVEGSPVEHPLPVEDVRAANFVRDHFLSHASYVTDRKIIIDYIKRAIYGTRIPLEEVYAEFEAQLKVCLLVPTVEIRGVAIKFVLEEKTKEARALDEEFKMFFEDSYVLEEGDDPIPYSAVRERFNEWKRAAKGCKLTLAQLDARMREKCGADSATEEYWGIRVKDYFSSGLLWAILGVKV